MSGFESDEHGETLPGQFWLANAPGVVVPGELNLGADGPRISLQGFLTPAVEPVK